MLSYVDLLAGKDRQEDGDSHTCPPRRGGHFRYYVAISSMTGRSYHLGRVIASDEGKRIEIRSNGPNNVAPRNIADHLDTDGITCSLCQQVVWERTQMILDSPRDPYTWLPAFPRGPEKAP